MARSRVWGAPTPRAAALAAGIALRVALGVTLRAPVWLSLPVRLVIGGDRLEHAPAGLLVSYAILGTSE